MDHDEENKLLLAASQVYEIEHAIWCGNTVFNSHLKAS